ncbi:protein E6 [Senna tora]|uniref:Protein E6 n=1 Tax=Senna tora TaxID=362788 RepID=A0A834W1S2_9FABA|nr:protein E6 [Senna tora]
MCLPCLTLEKLAHAASIKEFVDRGDAYGLYGTTSLEENNEKKKDTFKTEYPTTTLYSNNNEEEEEEYKNNNNNNEEYYNYNDRSSNSYGNNFNQDRFYSNNNNYYYKNAGYEKQGMSDTRYVENGKYFHDIKGENQNYNNYKAPQRGTNAYYHNNYKYPNEFDTMEEYDKQQESQGYVP